MEKDCVSYVRVEAREVTIKRKEVLASRGYEAW